MQKLAARILKQTRKGWFRTRPVFEPYQTVSEIDLGRIEETLRTHLPAELKQWLLAVGYGDIDQTLSFRFDWFQTVEQGHLRGAVIFAQDDLGNFYAILPENGNIVHFCRSAPEFAIASDDFRTFIEELERRDYMLADWMSSLPTQPYQWKA